MDKDKLFGMIPSLNSYEDNQKLLMNNILYNLSELDIKNKHLYIAYISDENVKNLFDTLITVIINRANLIINFDEIVNFDESKIYKLVYQFILSIYKQINHNIKSIAQSYVLYLCKNILKIYISFSELNNKTCSSYFYNSAVGNLKISNNDLADEQTVQTMRGYLYENAIINALSEIYHLPKLPHNNKGFDAIIITSPFNNSKRIIIEMKHLSLKYNGNVVNSIFYLRRNAKNQINNAIQDNQILPNDTKILISNVNLSSDSLNEVFDKIVCIPILPNGSIICVEEFKNLISYIQGIIDDEYQKYYNSTIN